MIDPSLDSRRVFPTRAKRRFLWGATTVSFWSFFASIALFPLYGFATLPFFFLLGYTFYVFVTLSIWPGDPPDLIASFYFGNIQSELNSFIWSNHDGDHDTIDKTWRIPLAINFCFALYLCFWP